MIQEGATRPPSESPLSEPSAGLSALHGGVSHVGIGWARANLVVGGMVALELPLLSAKKRHKGGFPNASRLSLRRDEIRS